MTEQEQRKLTEFLGECWHEWVLEITPKHGYRIIRCPKCFASTSIGRHQKPDNVRRLDFTDWRVKGRILDKFTDAGAEPKFTRYGVEVWGERYEDICAAVSSYMKERTV